VRNLFTAYRVLAMIVGVLLTVLVFVAVPLKYFPGDGSSLQVTGDNLTAFVGVAHGWIYMVYLVVSFALSRRLRWAWAFTGLVLLAGLIPILIFWVERRVTQRVRAEHPELVTAGV
jgi:integral membrane protein